MRRISCGARWERARVLPWTTDDDAAARSVACALYNFGIRLTLCTLSIAVNRPCILPCTTPRQNTQIDKALPLRLPASLCEYHAIDEPSTMYSSKIFAIGNSTCYVTWISPLSRHSDTPCRAAGERLARSNQSEPLVPVIKVPWES